MALAVLASTASPSAQRLPPAPPVANAGNVAIGEVLYEKIGCGTCHGPEGQGTATAPRLASTTLRLAAFNAYVRRPTGLMPPHSAQVIPDRGLADIYAFVRAQRPAPRPAPVPVFREPAPATGEFVLEITTTQPGPSTTGGRADAGATLFAKVGCYECHGSEAQGGPNGPRLGPDPIPLARLTQYVRSPSGEMPPYTEQVLSSQDLTDIYAFLQTRSRPPAVNTIPQLAP